MGELVREKGAYIAAWLPMLLLGLTIGCLVALWFARRISASARSSSRMYRSAKTIGWVLLPGCAIGLFLAYGPMSPLFRTAKRLDARVGTVVPEMTFVQVSNGKVRHLSDFRGKVLLVNLWATWCPPCRRELPTLNRLQDALGSRGLVVVTLSDETKDQLVGVLEKLAPHTVNGRVDSFEWLAIKEFRPFTLLIDRTGRLRDYSYGEQSYETFSRKVESYLQ